MKRWTLAAVSGLVGMVSVSSLGCAATPDQEETDTQPAPEECAPPSEGEVSPAMRTGNKIWNDDWLAPVSKCIQGTAEQPPAASTPR
jgi:hypothetical protein